MAQRGLVLAQPRVVPVAPAPKLNADSMHECMCGKAYRHLSSLCKHRRKCEYFQAQMMIPSSTVAPEPEAEAEPEEVVPEKEVVEEEEAVEEEEEEVVPEKEVVEEAVEEEEEEAVEEEEEEEKEAVEEAVEEEEEKEAVEEVVETKPDATALLIALLSEQAKRNDELKDMIERQGKQLEIVAAKVDLPAVTNVTTIHNTNKFNLNFFLNSECKDAMNVMDFVQMIKVTPADLERLADVGYVEGVARIMMDGLRKLDVCQRPIHCTDVKRESFYIKDKDVWEKDNAAGDKMHRVVKHVAHRNVAALPDWKKENPTHTDFTTRTHEKYLRIVNAAFGGSTQHEIDHFRNKIIRKAAPELVAPKKSSRIKMEEDGDGDGDT